MSAEVSVDWGGEHVHLITQEGTTNVSVAITPEVAAQMIPQLKWAIREVAHFGMWKFQGKDPWAYQGKPKPGRVGGESGVQ